MKLLGEFRRTPDGIERRFTKPEVRMIGNLARSLAEVLDGADAPAAYDDAVVARLLPSAAPDDPDAAAEFAAATRQRLAAGKAEGARRLLTDLETAPGGVVRLDDAGAVVWLKALGDLRIALAERIGIDELQRTAATPHGMLYAWLTWLQGDLVEVLDAD